MRTLVKIRPETQEDFEQVAALIKESFKNEPFSDQQEHLLVKRLRLSDAFVPDLSLVAERNREIVGYILLTKIKIVDPISKMTHFGLLTLAPVVVHPCFQRQGIGHQLIEFAHKKASELGFVGVVVLGHATYYPKFGYKPTKDFDIELPYDVPDENCMVVAFKKDSLTSITGTVHYPTEFENT